MGDPKLVVFPKDYFLFFFWTVNASWFHFLLAMACYTQQKVPNTQSQISAFHDSSGSQMKAHFSWLPSGALQMIFITVKHIVVQAAPISFHAHLKKKVT